MQSPPIKNIENPLCLIDFFTKHGNSEINKIVHDSGDGTTHDDFNRFWLFVKVFNKCDENSIFFSCSKYRQFTILTVLNDIIIIPFIQRFFDVFPAFVLKKSLNVVEQS